MVVVKRLIWKEININHIARHDVTPQEVEEACHNQPQIEKGYAGRLRLIGPTATNRLLAIILAPKTPTGTYYPVTARPASRKERYKYYQQ